jgi:hypothetical protein
LAIAPRVFDAEKAEPLQDKKAQPQLIDPEAGLSLVVSEHGEGGQLARLPLRERAAFEARRSRGCCDWEFSRARIIIE